MAKAMLSKSSRLYDLRRELGPLKRVEAGDGSSVQSEIYWKLTGEKDNCPSVGQVRVSVR
jgi:hypothetical protein